jgi:hypothetical protein
MARRKTLKTFVLIMSKNSASGRSGFWSPKVDEVPTEIKILNLKFEVTTVRFTDTVTDLPTFHKL